MIEVTYYVAISLDGFIATVDGGLDWLDCAQAEGEDYGYAEFFASVDGLAMGRATYDTVQQFGFWPYEEKPCWVWTHRPIAAAAEFLEPTAETPEAVVAAAEAEGLSHLWLVGGGQLASAFRDAKLITKTIISIIPTTLGRGLPLFAGAEAAEMLSLEASRQYETGVVQLTYLPKFGS